LILKREWLRQNYGIFIVGLWSTVLGVQNLSSAFLVAPVDQSFANAGPILVYRGLSGIFSLAFFAAAIGLLWRQHWGRILFQVAVIAFFAVSMFGLLASASNSFSPDQMWLQGGRFALSIVLPVIYLNWSPVKAKFNQPQKDNILTKKETPEDD
jgi:hypothetical protein